MVFKYIVRCLFLRWSVYYAQMLNDIITHTYRPHTNMKGRNGKVGLKGFKSYLYNQPSLLLLSYLSKVDYLLTCYKTMALKSIFENENRILQVRELKKQITCDCITKENVRNH